MRTASILILLLCAFALPASGDSDWCWDHGDYIYAEVDAGTITVHHDAAFYNCCPDSIVYSWTQEGNRFFVTETEINPQCLCFCCFDLTTSVVNVPPGVYEIDFCWERLGQELHRILQVVVPDEGQAGDLADGGRTCSACLDNEPGGVDSPPGDGRHLFLHPVRPNPAVDDAVIRFDLPEDGRATLAVYTSAGTLVRLLLDEEMSAGGHGVRFDCRDEHGRRLPRGLYFCALTAGGERSMRRVLVLH